MISLRRKEICQVAWEISECNNQFTFSGALDTCGKLLLSVYISVAMMIGHPRRHVIQLRELWGQPPGGFPTRGLPHLLVLPADSA